MKHSTCVKGDFPMPAEYLGNPVPQRQAGALDRD
jgi:hypothetical protein